MSTMRKYPRKRYVYKCKCGKRPMRGSITTDSITEAEVFRVLDQAWALDHDKAGCELASRTIEEVARK